MDPRPKGSHVVAGLNDYRFVVSLHIMHPSVAPQSISAALGLTPKRTGCRGDQRRSPAGVLRAETYDANHWTADLPIQDGSDVAEFLTGFVDSQTHEARSLTRQIADTGGAVELFIGLFATRCCDFAIPPESLRLLGEAGITLRLDYYPD